MVMGGGTGAGGGIDRTKLRVAALFVLIVAAFTTLFSRLYFLQVLASNEFTIAGEENRVRVVESEPPRGRILDAKGKVLVGNRRSLALTVERHIIDDPARRRTVLDRIATTLNVPLKRLYEDIEDATFSPYKPVAVLLDVPEKQIYRVKEIGDEFPGVDVERRWVRQYPQGNTAPHVLGYVNEISKYDLEEDEHFKGVKPRYAPGDIVGKSGIEYQYDRYLRGEPQIEKVVVNSTGQVVARHKVQDESPGRDVKLGVDIELQKLTERALRSGLRASQGAGYKSPAGGVIVMDPYSGYVRAAATFPTYDPRIAIDGFSIKEFRKLGSRTKKNFDDDALFFRPIGAQRNPASTFKIVTGGAALWSGVATPYTTLGCPASIVYPPNDPGGEEFNNYTTADFGTMGYPRSLEVSCDTFYYELGWRMERSFGPVFGDGTEKFQKYARRAGMGDPTGIDLPGEKGGILPDRRWCRRQFQATKHLPRPTCERGWLPGYSVNMAIGQGDMIVTPLQMAVTTSAIANRGFVWKPRVARELLTQDVSGKKLFSKQVKPKRGGRLGLSPEGYGVIEEGMELVLRTGEGTARAAFSGFPLDEYPLAGKTGTSELGETNLQDAWFVSYGPVGDPRYVVVVYMEKSGHGGETAAPVAREIWEGIFNLDKETSVRLGEDDSG
jgi:penicillin-binding protein 2